MRENAVPILLPSVRTYIPAGGTRRFAAPLKLCPPPLLAETAAAAAESFGAFFRIVREKNESDVRFVRRPESGREAYVLKIDEDGVEIGFSHAEGAFFALMTLRQMMLNGALPYCRIEDGPALPLRGYMLDVSRGKIPTVASLQALIDTLASLKYNHFQLYFEGAPFLYRGYEKYASAGAYTPAEITELDRYCRARGIEFVPNLNTLGHMGPWLRHERFRPLAELEDGFAAYGMRFPPTTLDCRDPAATDFALSLIDGLTPCYSARRVHVGLDEPFELGKGKNASLAAEYGRETLYVAYANRLRDALRKRGLTMMMWGDVVAGKPETARALADDIILLDWGYQAEYPFEARAKVLREQGRRFILCPGTSAWQSIGGITDNMTENVTRAAEAAKKYGAEGTLLTDWGDGGHVQAPFVSMPALALAAASGWGDGCAEATLTEALDTLIFRDAAGVLGGLVLELGRYARFEESALECRTHATLPLQFPDARGRRFDEMRDFFVKLSLDLMPADLRETYRAKTSARKPFDGEAFDAYIAALNKASTAARPACADAAILTDEISVTIALVAAAQRARQTLAADRGEPALAREIKRIAAELSRLWLLRNRPDGLEAVAAQLEALAKNLEKTS